MSEQTTKRSNIDASDHRPGKGKTLQDVIAQLDSSNASTLYHALVQLRTKYIKEQNGPNRISEKGGLTKLLHILNKKDNHGNKVLDVTLSILGNCAMVQAAREKMLELEAPAVLGTIFNSSDSESIQNRACRTLANMALDLSASCHIHQVVGMLPMVTKLLRETEDAECQQTYVRAVRVFANTRGHMYRVLQSRGLEATLTLLKSDTIAVLNAALNTLSHFIHIFQSDSRLSADCDMKHDYSWELETDVMPSTEQTQDTASSGESGNNTTRSESTSAQSDLDTAASTLTKPIKISLRQCQEEITRQLVFGEGLSSLVSLASHDERRIYESACNLLLSSVKVPSLRPVVGNAGAVPFFIQRIKDAELDKLQLLQYMNAVSLCCQEAVNRVRVRDCGGLELMVQLLGTAKWAQIHNRLISALVCFIYDDPSLDILLKNQVCAKLVEHLRRCSGLEPRETEGLETDNTSGCNDSDTVQYEEYTCSDDTTCVSAGESDTPDVPKKTKSDYKSELVRQTSFTEQPKDTAKSCMEDKTIQPAQACEDSENLSQRSTDPGPKYSMDSPTYQEISQQQASSDPSTYNPDAPTNIWESAQYYTPGPSARAFSPMSTTSYHSPEWGPASPPSSPPLSPTHSYTELSDGTVTPPLGYSGSPTQGLSPAQSWSPMRQASQSPGFMSPESSTLMSSSSSPLRARSPSNPIRSLLRSTSPLWFDDAANSPQWPGNPAFNLDEQVNEGSCPGTPATPDAQVPAVSINLPSLLTGGSDTDSQSSQANNTPKSRVYKRQRSATPDLSQSKKPRLGQDPASQATLSVDELMDNMANKPGKSTGRQRQLSRDCEDHISIDPHVHRDPQRLTQHNILVLLSRISYLTDPGPHLVQTCVMEALLDYVAKARRPLSRASRLLHRLTNNPHCFERLLQTLSPLMIDLKLSPEKEGQVKNKFQLGSGKEMVEGGQAFQQILKCHHNDTETLRDQLLSNLSVVMATRYGQGTMVHMLLSQEAEKRRKAALALPFICRGQQQEQKMLVDLNGLDLIVSCVKSSKRPPGRVFSRAVHALGYIARHRTLPQMFPLISAAIAATPSSHSEEQSKDIVFVMDDGVKVAAARKVMVQRSQVFEAMLTGSYCESGQAEVRLKQISSPAFMALVRYLHGESLEKVIEDCKHFVIEESLDSVGVCTDSEQPAAVEDSQDSVISESQDSQQDIMMCSQDSQQGIMTFSQDSQCDIMTCSQPSTADTEYTTDSSQGTPFSSQQTEPDDSQQSSHRDTVKKNPSLKLQLDMLVLVNHYMIGEAHSLLVHHISHHHLTPTTVAAILEFSLHHNSSQLTSHCLMYILRSRDFSAAQRVCAFNKMAASSAREDIWRALYNLLLSLMSKPAF